MKSQLKEEQKGSLFSFLSSPHLRFIIVFICDLFVSRDDPRRAGPGVERIGRTPPPLAQSVETWPIGVRLVCRELRPVSLEERILVIERVGCGRHATHYFGLNFS